MLRQTLLWTETAPWQEAPDFKCVTPQEVATDTLQPLLTSSKQIVYDLSGHAKS